MKYNSNGFIKKYKVRFVVQRFFQIYEINYIEIFVSTIRCKSLRIFLAITTKLRIILI